MAIFPAVQEILSGFLTQIILALMILLIGLVLGKVVGRFVFHILHEAELNRVLKKRNKKPDMKEPMILRKNATIRDICKEVHRDYVKKFKYARIWGPTAKFDGQILRKLDKVLKDKDVIELHTN